jgi:hypothetical protein
MARKPKATPDPFWDDLPAYIDELAYQMQVYTRMDDLGDQQLLYRRCTSPHDLHFRTPQNEVGRWGVIAEPSWSLKDAINSHFMRCFYEVFEAHIGTINLYFDHKVGRVVIVEVKTKTGGYTKGFKAFAEVMYAIHSSPYANQHQGYYRQDKFDREWMYDEDGAPMSLVPFQWFEQHSPIPYYLERET